ncbi:MAG: hypothetical protein WBD74_12790 [Candidatus Aquilonibacter sp.]
MTTRRTLKVLRRLSPLAQRKLWERTAVLYGRELNKLNQRSR